MWVCLNDAFLSIVHKDCGRDELLVRARRRDDIGRVFPNAIVKEDRLADYRWRAVIKRAAVEEAMVGEVRRINYGNFKNSVVEDDLHVAYLRVWTSMASLQPGGLFGDVGTSSLGPESAEPEQPKPKRTTKRRSPKRGQ